MSQEEKFFAVTQFTNYPTVFLSSKRRTEASLHAFPSISFHTLSPKVVQQNNLFYLYPLSPPTDRFRIQAWIRTPLRVVLIAFLTFSHFLPVHFAEREIKCVFVESSWIVNCFFRGRKRRMKGLKFKLERDGWLNTVCIKSTVLNSLNETRELAEGEREDYVGEKYGQWSSNQSFLPFWPHTLIHFTSLSLSLFIFPSIVSPQIIPLSSFCDSLPTILHLFINNVVEKKVENIIMMKERINWMDGNE